MISWTGGSVLAVEKVEVGWRGVRDVETRLVASEGDGADVWAQGVQDCLMRSSEDDDIISREGDMNAELIALADDCWAEMQIRNALEGDAV